MKNLAMILLVAAIGMIAATACSDKQTGKSEVENTTGGGGLFSSNKPYMGEWVQDVPTLKETWTVKIYKQGGVNMYEFDNSRGKVRKLVLHEGEDGIMYTIDKYGTRRDVVYDADEDMLIVTGFSERFKRVKRQ